MIVLKTTMTRKTLCPLRAMTIAIVMIVAQTPNVEIQPTVSFSASPAFLGTSVGSGAATAVVVATGKETYLGGMAEALQEHAAPTAFDRGISRFTMLMLGFMAVMVPLVFVINGLTKGTWGEAFFFAVAVAVGLTPEMLPMIVTICLSKGAVAMGKKKVIVKRINAIQNLGAMDVLCADKTGTLTQDQIILERHCDVMLRESQDVLALAYINSHFQTGLKSVLDRAVLAHEESHAHGRVPELVKIDEIPFDFERRIMSVVVRTPEGNDRIISKGAPEAIFDKCASSRLDGKLLPMDHPHIEELKKEYERLSADGFRVLAIATKDVPPHGAVAAHATPYGKADERELILEGYVAFLDPPKESALAAILALEAIHAEYESAVARGDFHGTQKSNDRFHTELFKLCGNEVLAQLVKQYMDLSYAIRANAFSDPEHLVSARREHLVMISLLSTRDSWSLSQLCVDHIQHSKQQYLAMLQREARNGPPRGDRVRGEPESVT